MARLILHVDLDAFYAAVEQRDRPGWRGLPLETLRGVVGALALPTLMQLMPTLRRTTPATNGTRLRRDNNKILD